MTRTSASSAQSATLPRRYRPLCRGEESRSTLSALPRPPASRHVGEIGRAQVNCASILSHRTVKATGVSDTFTRPSFPAHVRSTFRSDATHRAHAQVLLDSPLGPLQSCSVEPCVAWHLDSGSET